MQSGDDKVEKILVVRMKFDPQARMSTTALKLDNSIVIAAFCNEVVMHNLGITVEVPGAEQKTYCW